MAKKINESALDAGAKKPAQQKAGKPRKAVAAKAGYRKLPAGKGPHLTTPKQRENARFLSTLGIKPKAIFGAKHVKTALELFGY